MFLNEIIIIFSIFISIFFSIFLIKDILLFPCGNKKMIEVAKLIESCAKTYLQRQYKTIFFVSIFLALFIFLFLGKYYVLGFFIGSSFSGLIGYIGMLISVKANVRTANAARIDSLSKALDIAFKSGSVTGLLVISLSLLGIFSFYIFLQFMKLDIRIILNSLLALGFGASFISIFARLGGGIFTKSADIGADLVGKLEVGIPEDDSRNPAVIADNVGDNVGDCAGMAADLYETCCVTIIASMVLFGILCDNSLILYPLILGALSIFSTLVGIFFVKLNGSNVILALYKGFFSSVVCSIFFIFLYVYLFMGWNNSFSFSFCKLYGKSFFYSSLVGIFFTAFLVIVTDYYTSTKYYPVRDIARVSAQGHATNIIQGLAFSMEATTLPVLGVIFSILLSYYIAGIIGIAIAATSMVSLSGMIVALDAYGPVTDNAGGIAEMSNLDIDVRKKTDMLDSVGNTTKAITKGYAIGSAGLGSLVLFITYTEDLNFYFSDLKLLFSLKDPFVISGLFFGGIIPYLFSSLSMKAVGNVASKVVNEVRNQFSRINDISDNMNKPDYNKVVDLITIESIKSMILPSLLPLLLPIFLYIFIFLFFGKSNAFISLGSMLLGTIITGIFLAISMTSGGGAWDNAKKYIEDGNYGGKGSYSHSSAVTGDMVGDPYKDTAGPAINPLIKIANIVALLIVIFVSKF